MSQIGQHNPSLQVIACRHGVEFGLGEFGLVGLCYCPFTQVALLAGKIHPLYPSMADAFEEGHEIVCTIFYHLGTNN